MVLGAAVITISIYDSILNAEYEYYAEYSNPLRKHVEWGGLYGIYMVFTGVSSYFYHSSFTMLPFELFYYAFFNANLFGFFYTFFNAFFNMHQYRVTSFILCMISSGIVNLGSYYIFHFRNDLDDFNEYWIAVLIYGCTFFMVFVKYMIEPCKGYEFLT